MRRREFTAALGGAGAAGDADETNGRPMTRSSTRRSLMLSAAAIPLLAGAGAWSIGLGSLTPGPAAGQPAGRDGDGKRVTLLYFTDIHAHLESHPEYVPGASPEIQVMGGFARLKTAIERER